MARDFIPTWSRLIARALATLAHAACEPPITHSNSVDTQDQREYRQEREWGIGAEEPAWAKIRENLS